MSQRFATFLFAFLALLIGGLVHGFWSDRWRSPEELERARSRVNNVPLDIGAWRGQLLASDLEASTPAVAEAAAANRAALNMKADPDSFVQAGAQSYWVRSYTHAHTRQSFLVILMCGRPGRMSVHTPEVCYRGAGYEVAADPTRLDVRAAGDKLGELWTARFLKRQGVQTDLRLFWAWSLQPPWQAPDNPRWTFRGQPYLYKLYVSHEVPEPGASSLDQPALEFLQQFLPSLNGTLHAQALPP